MGACTSALNVEPTKPSAEMSGGVITAVATTVVTAVALTVETVVSVPIVAVRLAVATTCAIVATATVTIMMTAMAVGEGLAFLFCCRMPQSCDGGMDIGEGLRLGVRDLGRMLWMAVQPPFR